jgi:hypothetical protein
VLVLVLAVVLLVVLDAGGVEEAVSVMVAGGTGVAAVVVTVDVDVDVDTDVLEVLAGLRTPQAMRSSEVSGLWPPMSAPWCSTIDEPSGPLS